jgi:SAM-dependent methyltransferase
LLKEALRSQVLIYLNLQLTGLRKIYANEENVNFIVDNILNSKFKDNEFDYIFDRGCFHVLLPTDRQKYITKIKQILKKDNGILFLKCFSDKEPRQEGPYKFSAE